MKLFWIPLARLLLYTISSKYCFSFIYIFSSRKYTSFLILKKKQKQKQKPLNFTPKEKKTADIFSSQYITYLRVVSQPQLLMTFRELPEIVFHLNCSSLPSYLTVVLQEEYSMPEMSKSLDSPRVPWREILKGMPALYPCIKVTFYFRTIFSSNARYYFYAQITYTCVIDRPTSIFRDLKKSSPAWLSLLSGSFHPIPCAQ